MAQVPAGEEGRPTDSLESRDATLVPQTLRLVAVAGPDQGRELLLTRGTYYVGKAESCDLTLGDGAVSRRHIELSVTSHGIVVRDLDSKNGSFFRGARFSELVVGVGVVLTIGRTELRFAAAGATKLPPSNADHFGALAGRSLAMREVFALLERIAPVDAPVLIGGETGTGKELCAEAIHAASRRAERQFVVCDLGAISESLIESELFGHKRGAFTSADRDREGAFDQAHGGTLFVDEVGELRLEAQPRLLRALERHEVKPIGASRFRRVDTRVIAATHRNLAAECEAGRFRPDLYHRLAVLRVTLPPLRERREDIPFLIERFLAAHASPGEPPAMDAEARALLVDYDWPGNVRELKNVLERALSLGGEAVITPRHLGLDPREVSPSRFHEAKEKLIGEWERAYLRRLLERGGGNMARAARIAGLERAYLYRLMRKHGLRPEAEAP